MNRESQTLEYYARNAEEFVSGTIAADMQDTRSRFCACLSAGALILDFGCGSGRDTKAFLDAGYRVEATDGSEELCLAASRYTGIPVQRIPWSFVMNDELWNLMPMDSSLNSSKSNRLPQWDPFFRRFSDNQFILYQMIHDREEIHHLYQQCWRDNLHSIWAGQELYRPGNSKETFDTILSKNMRPIYDSAQRQGYEIWKPELPPRGIQS